MRLNIKPLSVNEIYTGRRFKTGAYKGYSKEVLYSLKRIELPKGKLEIRYKFGFSSKTADVDNCVKGFQDLLSKKYKFNDKMVYKIIAEKVDVEKGKEFIEFEILQHE